MTLKRRNYPVVWLNRYRFSCQTNFLQVFLIKKKKNSPIFPLFLKRRNYPVVWLNRYRFSCQTNFLQVFLIKKKKKKWRFTNFSIKNLLCIYNYLLKSGFSFAFFTFLLFQWFDAFFASSNGDLSNDIIFGKKYC